MADYDFENPTFDPDVPGIDDSFYLPDAPELKTSGDNIQIII